MEFSFRKTFYKIFHQRKLNCKILVEILENDDIKKLTSFLVISLLLGSIFITFGCLEDGDTDNTPKSARRD